MIYDTDLLEVEKDVDVDAGGGEEAGRHTKLSCSQFNAWKKKHFWKLRIAITDFFVHLYANL